MGKLTRLDIQAVIVRVVAVLREYPNVAGAYLFGSALDQFRPDSDIDIGLILSVAVKPESRAGELLAGAIAAALTPVDGHDFDIVLLNPDRPLFTYKVISRGRLIYRHDDKRITDVMEYVSRRYGEVYPRYRVALAEIMSEVALDGGY